MADNKLDRKAYEIVERHIPSTLPMDTPFVWAIEAVLEALASPPVAVQEEGDAKPSFEQLLSDWAHGDALDAARYRWLRDQPMPGLFHPQFAMHSATAWKNSNDIDAAIDAAMKGDQP